MIQSGTRLGRYEIAGMIASGGMGEVYRARDTVLQRDVAVKVLPRRLSSDPSLRERLLREARAISNLTHPHICTLFDAGQEDGADYLVMEYLDGVTLEERIASGPLPLDDVIRYGIEIADAVAAAHARGVVHRDLKPGNVMLTASGAKVLDFGLATAISVADETVEKPLTRTGHVVGTLQYMSPEQLRGDLVDARSDVFALGAILYEMRTGHRAFNGVDRTPPPHVDPAPLDAVIRRCLAADADARFHGARDVAFALQNIGRPGASRKAALIAGAAAIVAAVAAIAAFLILHQTKSSTNRPNTIAVLPLANLGVDASHDYLRLAIPDEITTILTYDPELTVRPFSSSRLLAADIDPQVAAKQLNAAAVVSGHVLAASGRLSVTLEATDARADRLLWRDEFDAPAADLVAMRHELGSRIENGLMPKLAGGQPIHHAQPATNESAYSLYLRAVAMDKEGQPNIDALQLLRRAVSIEPGFASAWTAIAQREYSDVAWGKGGEGARARSTEAATRALQLDPSDAEAQSCKITNETESGATADAAREAKRMVAERPRDADAHFTFSYALRYGGAIEESARECETANALDPGNRLFRSCATPFVWLGNREKAKQFESLDPGSALVHRLEQWQFIREHRIDDAIALTVPSTALNDLLAAYRDHAPEDTLQQRTAAVIAHARDVDDGEGYYMMAAQLAAIGRNDGALILLRDALSKNFCVVPEIDREPLFDALRRAPEFAEIHAAGARCHDAFMAALRD